ncbi:glycine cleavage system T protein [Candidatus Thiomargarita nelsonii]|uniref:Glycine cleavage system T protein n=1 Tax=Candidatus Thiomargarita nelsonii TaxID=1003181 RepID=A0A176S1R7_9GAMM|nr:glycine cleavage system T protein [Candidatus Thiomargarita nelsonii]
MGKFKIVGKDAFSFAQYLMTNDLNRIKQGQGIYTCFCDDGGGIVDDIIIYWLADDEFYFITNTLSRERVATWLKKVKRNKKFAAHIFDVTNTIAYAAVQGPKSAKMMLELFDDVIKKIRYFEFTNVYLRNVPIMIARTGYTGELGYELNFPSEFGHTIWGHLLEVGKAYGIKPVGGQAIQILRTEKSYRSHGTDMTEKTNPFEAGIDWALRLDKEEFAGKEALIKFKENGVEKKFCGFEVHFC